MRIRPLVPVLGVEGPDPAKPPALATAGGGQRVLREGSTRIRHLLECSRIAEAAGFKATAPEPVRRVVLRRTRLAGR